MTNLPGARTVVLATALSLLLAGCTDEPEVPTPTVAALPELVPPAQVAPPGTVLAVGAVALLQDGPDGTVATTVVDVVRGDASYWETFENAAEFEGMTPFFVVTQHRWETSGGGGVPFLQGLLEDGSAGGRLQTTYAGANLASGCPVDVGVPTSDREQVDCFVAAVPDGQEVVGASWDNTPEVPVFAPDPATNPYIENPVTWRK